MGAKMTPKMTFTSLLHRKRYHLSCFLSFLDDVISSRNCSLPLFLLVITKRTNPYLYYRLLRERLVRTFQRHLKFCLPSPCSLQCTQADVPALYPPEVYHLRKNKRFISPHISRNIALKGKTWVHLFDETDLTFINFHSETYLLHILMLHILYSDHILSL